MKKSKQEKSDTASATPVTPATTTAMVRIAATGGASTMSKTQKAFNRLIDKIASQREALAKWQAFFPRHQQRVNEEMVPALELFDEQKIAFMLLLDAARDVAGMTKGERTKLATLVRNMTEDLLDVLDDERVIAMYDKHHDVSYAQALQHDVDKFKDLVEDTLGFSMEDEEFGDARTPEEMLEALMGRMGEEMMAEEEAEAATAAQQQHSKSSQSTAKSAKAKAKEAAELEQAQAASQSVREIYRKLASEFHPDREPDPVERARKTALMQSVNQAYANKDLLQLLELQLRFEQIDAEHLATVDDSRLQHYVKVLQDQSRELDMELAEVTEPFLDYASDTRRYESVVAEIQEDFESELSGLRAENVRMKDSLDEFADVAVLRVWLKSVQVKRAKAEPRLSEMEMMFDAFSEAAGDDLFPFEEPPKKRKKSAGK